MSSQLSETCASFRISSQSREINKGGKLEKLHIDKTFLKEDLTSALEINKESATLAKLRRYLCGIDIPALSKQEDVCFHIQTTPEVFVCGGMFYVLLLFLVFG